MEAPWIAFEGLGIKFEKVAKSFFIFGAEIHWYGVLIAFGLVLAMILALRKCKKYGFTQDDILNYMIVCSPVAIIFARLYYVVFEWEKFASRPIEILYVWNGGLAIYGAIIGIVISAFIASKVMKHDLIKLFDFALPYVLIGQSIGRWGNFVNQEAYGVETSLPWKMTGSDIFGGTVGVHPNFLYESLWCILLFAFIMVYRSKWRKNKGELTCLYFMGYGLERAFMENVRGEDSLLFMGQKVSLWLSVVLVLVFGGIFIYLRFFKKPVKNEVAEDDTEEQESEENLLAVSDEENAEIQTASEMQTDEVKNDDEVTDES